MASFPPHQSRLRTAARTALYGSLILVGLTASSLLPLTRTTLRAAVDSGWYAVAWEDLPEVERFQSLLQIDTTPSGSELAAAEWLAGELEAVGIETHIKPMPGHRANLWAILEGEDRQAIVLANHLDTEPVISPEAWVHHPFSGAIDKPWVYGRGAFDMKSVTIAQLEAMLAAKRRSDEIGRLPSRSLIFLATSSEETGSDLGAPYLLAQYPELTERFGAVLTEGGVFEGTERGKTKYWGHSFAQKKFVQVWACSANRERLEDFVEDMRTIGRSGVPRKPTPEVLTFIERYRDTRQNPTHRRGLEQAGILWRDIKRFDKLPRYQKALFRPEAAVFPVVEHAPGEYRVRVSVHVLPGQSADEAVESLVPEWATWGLALEIEDPGVAPHGSPWSGEVPEAIERAIENRYGPVPQGPYFLSFYANDSRFYRADGIPSYGFTPFQLMSTDSLRMGMTNERLSLPEFAEGVALYRQLILDLLDLAPSESPQESWPPGPADKQGTS